MTQQNSPFASETVRWDSTMKTSSQNKSKDFTASNMPQHKTVKNMTGEEVLNKVYTKFYSKKK